MDFDSQLKVEVAPVLSMFSRWKTSLLPLLTISKLSLLSNNI